MMGDEPLPTRWTFEVKAKSPIPCFSLPSLPSDLIGNPPDFFWFVFWLDFDLFLLLEMDGLVSISLVLSDFALFSRFLFRFFEFLFLFPFFFFGYFLLILGFQAIL